MQIPEELLHKYPEDADRIGRQCKHFKNTCERCSQRFSAFEVICAHCGNARPRCRNLRLENAHCCRSHLPRKTLSIYNLAAGRISEAALDEVVENDDRSLDSEYAMAQLVLAQMIDDVDTSAKIKLEAVKTFFEIAKLRKTVETGEDLNIRFDDRVAGAIRQRFKVFVTSLYKALEKHIKDPDVRKAIMGDVRNAVSLVGTHTAVADGMVVPTTRPQGRTLSGGG